MGDHDIFVVGASAGGIEALTELFSRLPPDFPAAVFVVVHIPAHVTSVLPRIFNRNGPLPAEHAANGPIGPGRIYVAPPDHQLTLRPGRVVLSRGPKENGHRPSVDPLFRSAALAYGPRVVAAVLSGSLDDGTAGLAAVKERGGVTVAQSPDEALYPSMPRSAILTVKVDHVLPAAAIGDLFATLAGVPSPERRPLGEAPLLETEVRFDEIDSQVLHDDRHPGTLSGFGCPDCGGTLWEMSDSLPMRYRCRIGHAWTAGALLAEQTTAMESALWTALRTLEERASLCRRMSRRFKETGSHISSGRLKLQAEECVRSAEALRTLIAAGRPADAFDPAEVAADPAESTTPPEGSGQSGAGRTATDPPFTDDTPPPFDTPGGVIT